MKTLHTHNLEMEKDFNEYYPELLTEAGEVRNDVKNFITNQNKQLYIKIAEEEIERLESIKKPKNTLGMSPEEIFGYNGAIIENQLYWNNILQELNK